MIVAMRTLGSLGFLVKTLKTKRSGCLEALLRVDAGCCGVFKLGSSGQMDRSTEWVTDSGTVTDMISVFRVSVSQYMDGKNRIVLTHDVEPGFRTTAILSAYE
jgi:hypothetical protein